MIKDLIRKPLEQAMVLLWLLGMTSLLSRLLADQLSFSWVASAALAGLLAVFLESRYRLLHFITLPIFLELAAFLALLMLFGVETNALILATVLFALLLWLFSQYTIYQPLYQRLLDVLRLQHTNDDNITNTKSIICITHGTLFFIVFCAVSLQLFHSALLNTGTDHSFITLSTLLLAMFLLWLSRKRYPYQLNCYLTLLLLIFSIMECLSLSIHPVNFQGFAYDRYAGLILVSMSAGIKAISCFIRQRTAEQSISQKQSLYAKPLIITSSALVIIAFLLQAFQFIAMAGGRVNPLDFMVVFSAAALLFSSNNRIRLNDLALVMLLTATMWLIFWWLHPGASFSLWPDRQTFADQWLTLGILSLILASLSLYIEHSRPDSMSYCHTLDTVATGSYTWTLLGATQLLSNPFAFAENILSPFIWLVLIAGQVLVLRKMPYVFQVRGVAIVTFVFITLITSLTALQLISEIRIMMAFLAYGFLLVAVRVLPNFNRRYPQWAISPLVWPWAGLMSIYVCLFLGGPNWVHEWPWLFFAALYQLLLRKPYLNFPAILLMVLALLWSQASVLRPDSAFSLSPGQSVPVDLWLSLSICALLLSLVSHISLPKLAMRYSQPLNKAALLCYIWSLVGSITLLVATAASNTDIAGVFLILFVALFPVTKYWRNAYYIRGLSAACLLSLAMLTWGLQLAWPVMNTLLIWSYILWFLGWGIIPWFNNKQPEWALEPSSWAWLGLLLIASSSFALDGFGELRTGVYFLAVSVYCLLMHRYCRWKGLSWIAVLAFCVAGFAFNSISLVDVMDKRSEEFFIQRLTLFSLGTLLWVNLQLWLLRFWHRNASQLTQRWNWQREDLCSALMFFAEVILLGYLVFFIYCIFILLTVLHVADDSTWLYAIITGTMLCVSITHILTLSFHRIRLHELVLSCLSLAWACYFAYPLSFLPPALFMTLCSAIILAVLYSCSARQYKYKELIEDVLTSWVQFSLIIASIALLMSSENALQETLLNLAVIIVLTAFWGLWTLRPKWFFAASMEFFIFLHCWPFLWFTLNDLNSLYPWYALQAATFGWLFLVLIKRSSQPDNIQTASDRRKAISHITLYYWPWLIVVSLGELLAHILLVNNWMLTTGQGLWLMYPLDPLAALTSGIIICGIGVRHVKKIPDSLWIYAIVVLIALLGFYLRLITQGITPVGLWDTAILIVFAFILFILQHTFRSRPLLNLAMLMPLLALFTVPFQLNSLEASLTLLVTGCFYLLVRHDTQRQLPAYLALLAFNTGIYLWVPGFVQQSQLIQVYVIPAALSVLVLLQLHRRELKHSVLMATRLAALSTIYAAATLDVFLLPDLKIFILAILLSLSGLVLGIALRVRVYLYTGISFLLLNVAGQFIQFYPEQMLGKALVLMFIGVVIISVMIWFNIKRAAILPKIRLIQEELQEWE